jgi:hypothetical protein
VAARAGRLVRARPRRRGPARSEALWCWLFAVDEGRLRLAGNADATDWWLTPEETERAAREAVRAAAETERVAKEAALARVAELEAELAALRDRG